MALWRFSLLLFDEKSDEAKFQCVSGFLAWQHNLVLLGFLLDGFMVLSLLDKPSGYPIMPTWATSGNPEISRKFTQSS